MAMLRKVLTKLDLEEDLYTATLSRPLDTQKSMTLAWGLRQTSRTGGHW